MTLYGIWYDDGRMDFGWLSEEHGNGRIGRIETDLEDAEKIAERHREYNPESVWVVEPINVDHDERFRRVRKLALEHRLKRAYASVEEIRKAIERHERDEEHRALRKRMT